MFELIDTDCGNVANFAYERLAAGIPEVGDKLDEEAVFEKYGDELYDAGFETFCSLSLERGFILECLSENPYYGKRIKEYAAQEKEKKEREEKLKASLVKAIPDRYVDLYPLARKMNRKFILHIGPTNSGKTFAAMQRLKEAGEGIYLAPLRLLAFEQYEALNAAGFPCSLVTGEERAIKEGAKIQASTVEMMDPVATYPVTVLDEAQMIADKDRGWAWTAAILGVCSSEIHVCAAPEAEKILISLIQECGDTCEIVRHERQTALTADSRIFRFPESVEAHDALIVFSKRNVHAVAYELRQKGKKCSIIYGNLPYDVRQAEARKFATGETDVLVATDAIGMGLNLPIKRIVFLETSKFDGVSRRTLLPEEIRQIAGRAGRQGIFEEGKYTAAGGVRVINAGLSANVAPITRARIGFSEALVGIPGKLSEILEQWQEIPDEGIYNKMDVATMASLAKELEVLTDDKDLIYRFITIPFNPEGAEKETWNELVMSELNGERYQMEDIPALCYAAGGSASLDDMEQMYKVLDLLYSYNIRFNHPEDIQEILLAKKNAVQKDPGKAGPQRAPAQKMQILRKAAAVELPIRHVRLVPQCHVRKLFLRLFLGRGRN